MLQLSCFRLQARRILSFNTTTEFARAVNIDTLKTILSVRLEEVHRYPDVIPDARDREGYLPLLLLLSRGVPAMSLFRCNVLRLRQRVTADHPIHRQTVNTLFYSVDHPASC